MVSSPSLNTTRTLRPGVSATRERYTAIASWSAVYPPPCVSRMRPKIPCWFSERVAGETDVAVEEDEQEIARAGDRVEEADGRLLAQPQVLPHALARVEEQAEVERELLARLRPAGGGEDEHLLLPPVLAQDEVFGPQVRDEPAPRVAGGDRDLDDVEPDPEHRRLLGRRQRGGSERCAGSRRRRSGRADGGGDGAQDETGEASGDRARHVTDLRRSDRPV